jgi:ABC-2 type transport system ATP-binding protein
MFYRILLETYNANPRTIIISTHLIEEVSSVIEDIVILKKGKIIKNESCETLLSNGYTISGTAAVVDSFVVNKNVIGTDTLGGLKSAYILGKLEGELPSEIELSKLDLQKLFIQLTNS